MHLDVVAARRTQAGAPVVHGIHLLLWSVEQLCVKYPNLESPISVQARFDKFCYVGDTVEVCLVELTPATVRLELRVDETPISLIHFECGSGPADPATPANPANLTALGLPAHPGPKTAIDLNLEQMRDLAGRLAFTSSAEASAAQFSHASRWLGASRVAACAATTLLVGMVCPGLHSMYGKLKLSFIESVADRAALAYKVVAINERFRMVRLAVAGGGVEGTLETFARLPPQAQANMGDLQGKNRADAFAGSTVLVVGGSRGLGELTAKLAAAGGADVIITYKVGRHEAEAVAAEIQEAGGRCSVAGFDAGQPAGPQLDGLRAVPTHAYYFPTPSIFRRQTMFFDAARLDSFMDVYVRGFWRLCEALRALRKEVVLFYPSSVALTQRPAGMLEYTMAKAAGEALCQDINDALAPTCVIVERLPRLPTDQTASFTAAATADPVETMQRVLSLVQHRI